MPMASCLTGLGRFKGLSCQLVCSSTSPLEASTLAPPRAGDDYILSSDMSTDTPVLVSYTL